MKFSAGKPTHARKTFTMHYEFRVADVGRMLEVLYAHINTLTALYLSLGP